jgi:hypothetical protein
MPKSIVDRNGVGYTVIYGFSPNFKLCSCPENWNWRLHGHHPSCVRDSTCFFCQMKKDMCNRLRICKGGSFKDNLKRANVEEKVYEDIFQNLMATLQRLFQQVATLIPQIPESDKKKSSCKKAMDCRKQYEEMKLVQNPSAANVDSAEKCLYKLKCVYTDLKSMLKPKQSSA